MKKGLFVVSLVVGLLLMMGGLPAGAVTYGRADISIPVPEHPPEFYKSLIEKEIIPGFVAELKKQYPNVGEEELAERLTVQSDPQGNRVQIYVRSEHEKTGIAQADRLAELALRTIIARDQAERTESLERNLREQEKLQAQLKPLQKESELLAEQPMGRDSANKRQLLSSRMNAYQKEVAELELRKADLQTKMDLLAKRAARARDSVSIEEVAFLQARAQELAMQLDEASKVAMESQIQRCEIILMQKKRELERIQELHKRNVVSEEELNNAEVELRLAENDYVLAKTEMERASRQLPQVKKELEKAKSKLAETGGLQLATVIAEKMLECDIELAAINNRLGDLRERIEATDYEVKEIEAFEARYAKLRGEIAEPERQLHELQAEEGRLEQRMITARNLRERLRDNYRVSSVSEIELARERGTYDVVGEVKDPGSQALQLKTGLLQAVTAAGGFTEDADPTRVILIRAGGQSSRRIVSPRPGVPRPPRPAGGFRGRREIVDCQAILKGELPDEFVLERGDIVLVPRKRPSE